MGKYILVVDDDTLPRRSLSFQLEQVGYSTGTAASAEYAVAHVEVERTDLILLDVGLLGMDGLKALRHFQNDMAIPVILVTARRRELNKILGLELGADSFITKPFNPYVLLAHVKAVLRRSSHDSRFPKGLGLGLTIARDMVEAHGGQLVVSSEEDQGSQFVVHLPLNGDLVVKT
jgi:DNA-binding response OmpR family regulator